MADTKSARRDSGDLSALLLPELRKIANNLGIENATELKKPDLVKAITDLQAANREAAKAEREARRAELEKAAAAKLAGAQAPVGSGQLRQLRRRRLVQGVPVRLAGEQLAVPPHGAGL
ncbi:MAG: hypothetical protein RL733_926, partial [Actinomycetota bacterium]